MVGRLGWLRGLPGTDPDGAPTWIEVPRDEPLRARPLRRELLRQAEHAARALPRRFPRALDDALSDRAAWERATRARLDALAGVLHHGRPWPDGTPLVTSRRLRLRAERLADAGAAAQVQALTWTLAAEPSALAAALERLDALSPALPALSARGADGFVLGLLLCERAAVPLSVARAALELLTTSSWDTSSSALAETLRAVVEAFPQHRPRGKQPQLLPGEAPGSSDASLLCARMLGAWTRPGPAGQRPRQLLALLEPPPALAPVKALLADLRRSYSEAGQSAARWSEARSRLERVRAAAADLQERLPSGRDRWDERLDSLHPRVLTRLVDLVEVLARLDPALGAETARTFAGATWPRGRANQRAQLRALRCLRALAESAAALDAPQLAASQFPWLFKRGVLTLAELPCPDASRDDFTSALVAWLAAPRVAPAPQTSPDWLLSCALRALSCALVAGRSPAEAAAIAAACEAHRTGRDLDALRVVLAGPLADPLPLLAALAERDWTQTQEFLRVAPRLPAPGWELAAREGERLGRVFALRAACEDPLAWPPWAEALPSPAWTESYPAALRAALSRLDEQLGPERAATWTARALRSDLPAAGALVRELLALRAKLALAHSPGLEARARGLQARLGRAPSLSPARLARLALRIQRRAELAWLEHLEASALEAAREGSGLASRLARALGGPEEPLFVALSRLPTRAREAALELVERRGGPLPLDLRDAPQNAAFLAQLAARGLRLEAWLGSELQVEVPLADGQSWVLRFEHDPLEVLRMGEPFDTCLAPTGCNFFSALSNALDVNKRVVYARDASGGVRGRCLLAIDGEGWLLSYRLYACAERHALQAGLQAFVAALCAASGLRWRAEGTPPRLLASRWYDDGPQDLRGEEPAGRAKAVGEALSQVKTPEALASLLWPERAPDDPLLSLADAGHVVEQARLGCEELILALHERLPLQRLSPDLIRAWCSRLLDLGRPDLALDGLTGSRVGVRLARSACCRQADLAALYRRAARPDLAYRHLLRVRPRAGWRGACDRQLEQAARALRALGRERGLERMLRALAPEERREVEAALARAVASP